MRRPSKYDGRFTPYQMLLLILAMMIKERNGFAPNLLAYMMMD